MAQTTREQLAAADFESLMLEPKFKRFLYTVFETCGMFTGNFHSVDRIHAMSEGRRSLGLDILRTAERYAGPTALMQILEAETSALKETKSGQSRTDYAKQRRSELGGDDEQPELRQPGDGLVYLDYGTGE